MNARRTTNEILLSAAALIEDRVCGHPETAIAVAGHTLKHGRMARLRAQARFADCVGSRSTRRWRREQAIDMLVAAAFWLTEDERYHAAARAVQSKRAAEARGPVRLRLEGVPVL